MINKFLGIQDNAAAHGAELDFMLEMLHWFALILFVVWTAFFIYTLFRFRKSRSPKADYQGVKGHLHSYSEIIVCVVEAVLLIGFALPLWAKRMNEFPGEKQSTIVRVVAQQFAWNVHYPGPDGKFGRTRVELVDGASNPVGIDRSDPAAKDDFYTVNQLRIPVGKPVIAHISSLDVIHSFKLLQMRSTQDAIPGMSIPLWFTPNKEGKFEIICAQLCGNSHYRMRGETHVVPQAEYDAWVAKQVKEAAEAPASYE